MAAMNRREAPRDAAAAEPLPTPTFAVLVYGSGLYLGWQTIGISPTLFPQPSSATRW